MLIGDMNILRFMIYVIHIEEEKLSDQQADKKKKSKTGIESG